MTDQAKLKAQADFLFKQAMGQARASGLDLGAPKASPLAHTLARGPSMAILGAEAVAGGLPPPGGPHISTERAARAHARKQAPKTDADIDAIIEANRRRRAKLRRQAKGVKA